MAAPNPQQEEADALARQFLAGEPGAFGSLVELLQARFYRIAYRVTGDSETSLDVVQDAFVKIHKNAASWDQGSRFTSWSYRIVTNLAIDTHRRRGRERKAVESRAQAQPRYLDDHCADGLVAEERAELVSRVKDAISQLPPKQQAIVALRHYEGFSLKEIAEIRGCALGTVKSTLHQAFRNLRKHMGQELLEQVGGRA